MDICYWFQWYYYFSGSFKCINIASTKSTDIYLLDSSIVYFIYYTGSNQSCGHFIDWTASVRKHGCLITGQLLLVLAGVYLLDSWLMYTWGFIRWTIIMLLHAHSSRYLYMLLLMVSISAVKLRASSVFLG